MKALDKLKKDTTAKIKSIGKEKSIILCSLSNAEFKKGTEENEGFGIQDLKPTYKAYMDWLMKKYGVKIMVKPWKGMLFPDRFGVTIIYYK